MNAKHRIKYLLTVWMIDLPAGQISSPSGNYATLSCRQARGAWIGLMQSTSQPQFSHHHLHSVVHSASIIVTSFFSQDKPDKRR